MNGIVIIDKPAGKTSHAVVADVKKILSLKKAGHTGTLDPLATGVLPVCVNEGTKLAQFFVSDSKEYRATMRLGVETDTLDSDGKIVAHRQIIVDEKEIFREIVKRVGKIKQTPPQFSAVKHDGKPLYKWARKGVHIDIEPREIEIFSIDVEEIALPCVTFCLVCSKGTYIRSLCADIGKALGCGACLTRLRRTRNGAFSAENALSLENLADEEKKTLLERNIIPIVDTLQSFPSIDIGESLADRIRSGHQPTVENMKAYQISFLGSGAMVKFTSNRSLIAIGKLLFNGADIISTAPEDKSAVKILRVFNH